MVSYSSRPSNSKADWGKIIFFPNFGLNSLYLILCLSNYVISRFNLSDLTLSEIYLKGTWSFLESSISRFITLGIYLR
jgi:hypothetical protein